MFGEGGLSPGHGEREPITGVCGAPSGVQGLSP